MQLPYFVWQSLNLSLLQTHSFSLPRTLSFLICIPLPQTLSFSLLHTLMFFPSLLIQTLLYNSVIKDRTIMSNSTTDIAQQFEGFLYTPYGLATLAVVAILLTSLVWSVGCCIYCCCRRRQRLQQGGVTEASRWEGCGTNYGVKGVIELGLYVT